LGFLAGLVAALASGDGVIAGLATASAGGLDLAGTAAEGGAAADPIT